MTLWCWIRWFPQMKERMAARSTALLFSIDSNLDRILRYWLIVASAVAVLRISMTPHRLPIAGFQTFSSYFLLVAAPVISTLLALRWFSDGDRLPQPARGSRGLAAGSASHVRTRKRIRFTAPAASWSRCSSA